MWEARDYIHEWKWILEGPIGPDMTTEQLGWRFTCPKCDCVGVIPTEEGYQKCLKAEIPPPKKFEDAWISKGEPADLTLHPSVVCTFDECDGHYWVANGKIINC